MESSRLLGSLDNSSNVYSQRIAARLGISEQTGTIIDTVSRLVFMLALCWIYARHWRAFKRAPWRGTALVIVGAIGLQVVLGITKSLIDTGKTVVTDSSGGTGAMDDLVMTWPVFWFMVFISLSPVATVFIEEIVFRYTLLERLPVWKNALTLTIAVLINNIIFGVIHYYNAGGELVETIPFMAAGLLMNLVFVWTRNVWHATLMHLLNNFILGGPISVILLGIAKLFIGQ